MELLVKIKNVYGSDLIYSVAPESAVAAVAGLTGKKTIDMADIKFLNVLGIQCKTVECDGLLLEGAKGGG